MKAAFHKYYGLPQVLEIREVDKPVPVENEVLVKVYAAGVNRTDCANLSAKPFIMRFVNGLFKPRKNIPGTTFAGRVEEVGPKVKEYRTGDRVFGFDDSGLASLAEYLCFPEDKAMAPIPGSVSYPEAAAGIEGAHYAINFLNKVTLEKDSRVLVNGGTGAIGSAAIQLLGIHGARVTAVCGTKHLELVKSLGAEAVIDYQKQDFTQSGLKFDFVFDAVGKSRFGKCKPLLNPGGAYISSELGPMAENLFLALTTPFLGGKMVKFPVPLHPKKSVSTIGELMKEGKFKPLIDRSYPLEEIVQAYTYVASGRKIGNVIINLA